MYSLSSQEREKLKKYLAVKAKGWIYEDVLWKKVVRYKKIFSYIPWVRAICICNSLAMNACHQDSDIDLFIITDSKRLWTTRIYMTLFTFLCNIRKTQERHAGRFCLSFFVSLDEKNFSDISLENDMYFTYWLETLIPIVNKNKAFERFLERNGITNTKHKLISESLLFTREDGIQGRGVWVLKIFWDTLEKLLKKIFLPKTLRGYEKLGKPYWIVITDTMLKFHNHDRRKEIRDSIM